MNSLNTASVINLLGFTVGIALYALLLVMVARRQKSENKFSFDFLLLLTAVLGLLWNIGELSVFVWKDFGAGQVSPLLLAISYSALGFLPSVVVHSAWKNSESENFNARVLTFAAYGLSFLAALLHFQTAVVDHLAPSAQALRILTFGAPALIVGLLIFNFKQPLENKFVWITGLLIFAVSALHLSSRAEDSSWLIEIVAHQSSLPLALVILLQDYRFAFADLFLKRALSLLLLSLTAFSLYVFVASPLLALHESHNKNDAQAVSVSLTFWVATALIYPSLHQFAVWLVDKIILRRADYEKLRSEILEAIEKQNTVETILEAACERLARALTAKSEWSEASGNKTNLPAVNYSQREAEIFVPTSEAPFYAINLKDFSGGRRLLSDEIEMLEAIAFLTARRIDAARITDERYRREIREREFSKLATEAELRALRAQINPHFLFNALTTIGYLINAAPEKAFATLMKLTQLLRRVLKSAGEFSTLGEEIELIKSYLEIEQARFEERLAVEIDVAKDLEIIRVPSFILQPLVENAVKHGISKAKNGGLVKISARLETERENVFIKLSVFDSGAGISKDELLPNKKKGVGLNNIEQRLGSYYGKTAVLKIESEPGKGTAAEIKFKVPGSKSKKL